MSTNIALPIASIHHARGLRGQALRTQLVLDGADQWTAEFAARQVELTAVHLESFAR